MSEKIDYSIILAAGKGTRFYSSLPKVLHRLSGKTLLQRSIEAVMPHTKKEVIIVAGHGYDLVKAEAVRVASLYGEGAKIRLVMQNEQLGTGHAAGVAIWDLPVDQSSVLIIPGDCPLIDSSSLSDFVSNQNHTLSVLSIDVLNPKGFGRIVKDKKGNIQRIVEEKDATPDEKKISEISTSIYLSRLDILKKYIPKLSNSNAQGEYYLTDVVSLAVKDNLSVCSFMSQDNDSFLGANSRRELYDLQERKRLKELNKLMERGVTIQSVETCFIDDTVEIGQDVYIGANTTIEGNTKISNNVVIEGNALIRNAQIGEGVRLRFGAYLDDCEVGDKSELGPFFNIRPKSCLSRNVKIGNFVEVKASNLSEGVKANHLAYLGDIDIGANTNVGAGTIICNYDGKKKHRSKIGKNSFVGSNSTVISPREIGDDAYVAAGSVINKDVPDNALAIARGRQENKTGWVKKS